MQEVPVLIGSPPLPGELAVPSVAPALVLVAPPLGHRTRPPPHQPLPLVAHNHNIRALVSENNPATSFCPLSLPTMLRSFLRVSATGSRY